MYFSMSGFFHSTLYRIHPMILFLSFFFVASFMPQIFTEHLLQAKHYASTWGHNGNKSDKALALLELV